jgi:putative flippase GtrA
MLQPVPVKLRYLNFWKLIRFGMVGGVAAILYFAASWLLILIHVRPGVAVSIAFAIAVLWNYLMHYHWTFNSAQSHTITVRRFGVMVLFGLVLNVVIVVAGTAELHAPLLLVQIVAVGFVVLANLILSTLWVFSGETAVRD